MIKCLDDLSRWIYFTAMIALKKMGYVFSQQNLRVSTIAMCSFWI